MIKIFIRKIFYFLKRKNLLRIFLLGFLLIFLTLFCDFVLIEQNKREEYKHFERQLEVFSEISTHFIMDTYLTYYNSGFLEFQDLMKKFLDSADVISRFKIIDTKANILFDSKTISNDSLVSDFDIPVFQNGINTLFPSFIRDSKNDAKINAIIYPYIEEWGTRRFSIIYYPDYTELYQKLRNYRVQVIIFSFLLFLLSFSVSIFLILIREINLRHEESQKLKDLQEQKDNFMVLITHYLRIPVAILEGSVHTLKVSLERNAAGDIRGTLNSLENEIQKLNSIIENIIVSAYLTERGTEIEKEKIDFTILVRDILKSFNRDISEKRLHIIFNTQKRDIFLDADSKKLSRAISNIIDNAIKFNKIGGKVIINLEKNRKKVLLTIEDTGIGMSEKDIENLFKAFYKPGEFMVYDYPGLG